MEPGGKRHGAVFCPPDEGKIRMVVRLAKLPGWTKIAQWAFAILNASGLTERLI